MADRTGSENVEKNSATAVTIISSPKIRTTAIMQPRIGRRRGPRRLLRPSVA